MYALQLRSVLLKEPAVFSQDRNVSERFWRQQKAQKPEPFNMFSKKSSECGKQTTKHLEGKISCLSRTEKQPRRLGSRSKNKCTDCLFVHHAVRLVYEQQNLSRSACPKVAWGTGYSCTRTHWQKRPIFGGRRVHCEWSRLVQLFPECLNATPAFSFWNMISSPKEQLKFQRLVSTHSFEFWPRRGLSGSLLSSKHHLSNDCSLFVAREQCSAVTLEKDTFLLWVSARSSSRRVTRCSCRDYKSSLMSGSRQIYRTTSETWSRSFFSWAICAQQILAPNVWTQKRSDLQPVVISGVVVLSQSIQGTHLRNAKFTLKIFIKAAGLDWNLELLRIDVITGSSICCFLSRRRSLWPQLAVTRSTLF